MKNLKQILVMIVIFYSFYPLAMFISDSFTSGWVAALCAKMTYDGINSFLEAKNAY